jgi:hypothetical protein
MPDGLSLGVPSYGGSGCPAGSAAAALSPDGRTLSILFDRYDVQAGGTSGNTIDRKSCNISVPVNVPAGYSVSIFKIDYRGYNALPWGALSQFNVEYFFAGSQGPRLERRFEGPLNSDFLLTNSVQATAVSWSACGESVNLRANTSLMVQTNNSYEQAMSTLDSADIDSAVLFQLQFRPCTGYPDPFPGPGPGPVPGPGPGPIPPLPGPGPIPGPGPLPPMPGTASCTIDQTYDYYGRVVYNVRDSYGRVLSQHLDYASANRAVVNHQRSGQCSTQGGSYPYPPRVPISSCSIAQGRNSYGQLLYRVMTRSGAVVHSTLSYNDALRIQSTHPACLR